MDFNERVIPNVSANFLYQEAFARYVFASKQIRKDSFVLDLGCGTGYGSYYLSKKNKVTAIDIDQETISYAKKHYGDSIKFLRADISKEIQIDEKFDAICSFEVIEHLNDVNKYLDNIKKLLKPSGKLILSTPNSKIFSPDGKPKSEYHVKEFDKKELERLLKKKFKKVEMFGQNKSNKAKDAFRDFLLSQNARQSFVDRDKLRIRKLIPKSIKEKMWKYIGSSYGRKTQENLTEKDFPITKKNIDTSEYFIVICTNK